MHVQNLLHTMNEIKITTCTESMCFFLVKQPISFFLILFLFCACVCTDACVCLLIDFVYVCCVDMHMCMSQGKEDSQCHPPLFSIMS